MGSCLPAMPVSESASPQTGKVLSIGVVSVSDKSVQQIKLSPVLSLPPVQENWPSVPAATSDSRAYPGLVAHRYTLLLDVHRSCLDWHVLLDSLDIQPHTSDTSNICLAHGRPHLCKVIVSVDGGWQTIGGIKEGREVYRNSYGQRQIDFAGQVERFASADGSCSDLVDYDRSTGTLVEE